MKTDGTYVNVLFRSYSSCVLALLALTACDNNSIAETVGLQRHAPDEFTIVSRPSLSVPPEFTLRPPLAGAPPRGVASDEAARQLLTGTSPVVTSDAPSSGASVLLQKAGAEKAQEDIRTQLGEDDTKPADTSKANTLLEKLNGADKAEPIVDARKEAERLRTNKDAGKPATEGETPTEKPKAPGVLDRIL